MSPAASEAAPALLAPPPLGPAPKAPVSARLLLVVGLAIALVLSGILFTLVLLLHRSKPPEPEPIVALSSSRATATVATATSAAPPATTSAAPTVERPPASATATATIAGPRACRVTVSCVPPCDAIHIDGVRIDGNPIDDVTVPVEPGEHVVTANRGVHPTQTKTIKLSDGQEEAASFIFYAPGMRPNGPKKNCGKFLKRCD